MNTQRKLAVIAAGVLVLVVAFVVLGSGDPAKTTTTTAAGTSQPASTAAAAPSVPTVTFAGGKPSGGVQTLSFTKGDEVRFKVTSDVADEIHVHGFDKMADVKAGGTVSFDFPATFDGQYVVEMEGAGTQIASLEIQP